MDITITDGVALMPPPFSAGLGVWSYQDGTPGSGSYAGQANAAYVPADQDFSGCLELQKTTTTQKLRYMAQTPILPGVYLRISARVKAMSGNLPTMKVAAWAGNAGGNVASAPVAGPQVTLTSYGQVVTISAIVGVGNRQGVDLVWGPQPTYGYFGLDLTGPNGGVVRIDDIAIEDVTEVFARKLMDWVDVRDYGAKGDGITDDSAAFNAADAAAGGRSVLVSAGSYFLGSNVTFESAVRFEGTVTMPATARLALTRSYDLDTYEAAFGSEIEGFRRMLQALFSFTDHSVLDLGGRQVQVTEPIDVAAVTGVTTFAIRRVLTNGQLNLVPGTAWNPTTVTAQASYAVAQPQTLTGIANVAQIAVGSLVTGTGVGREVYVTATNVGAGTVTLSQPLWGAAGTQSYSFTRFRYALDFSGFARLDKFEITDLEFYCSGIASALMLPPVGTIFRLSGCVINSPKDRGITSIGTGCQGMLIDETQFLSNEQALRAQDRVSIALNVNANDVKLRNNRIVRFRHFAVMNGSGHTLIGNHFFQGDGETLGVRLAGVVLTGLNVKTTITANYIDDCFIEWSNEHDPTPDFSNEFSYGGLTLTGNIFTVINVGPSFRWFVIAPKGVGHYIQGLTVSNNVFRPLNGNIDRVEMVDTTVAGLDFSRTRNCVWENNAFNAVNQSTVNPVSLEFAQNTAAVTWTLDPSAYLPFGGWARYVTALIAEGAIKDASGAKRFDMPYVLTLQGSGSQQVTLTWPVATQGKMMVTTRVDNPN
ncbi:MAG: right-handed parallel beta-helix repeat-containing protein [Rhodobacteraceae bacterium]|nr:right-handed parallel beta-helix repeat-containing protein [Paracoccaceae bacterium]